MYAKITLWTGFKSMSKMGQWLKGHSRVPAFSNSKGQVHTLQINCLGAVQPRPRPIIERKPSPLSHTKIDRCCCFK